MINRRADRQALLRSQIFDVIGCPALNVAVDKEDVDPLHLVVLRPVIGDDCPCRIRNTALISPTIPSLAHTVNFNATDVD